MPRSYQKYVSLLWLMALLASCGGQNQARNLRGAQYSFDEGQRALERKRYFEAVEHFQRVVSNFPGSVLICDAQFFLAKAYFQMEDYVNAVFEYERLVDAYPTCRWSAKAQFQTAESYFIQMRRPELDQQETHEALRHFYRFIDDNPGSPLVGDARERIAACRERLAEKQFKSAHLYRRQGFLEAARITYELLLREYPDVSWIYYRGMAQLGDVERRDSNIDKARFYWDQVIDECEDEELRRDVLIWRSELDQPPGE